MLFELLVVNILSFTDDHLFLSPFFHHELVEAVNLLWTTVPACFTPAAQLAVNRVWMCICSFAFIISLHFGVAVFLLIFVLLQVTREWTAHLNTTETS